MAGAFVIVIAGGGIYGATQDARGGSGGSEPRSSRVVAADLVGTATVRESCRSARKAVATARARTWRYQDRRGSRRSDRTPIARGKSCHWARYAARTHVARARSSQRAYRTWAYHWDWKSWLPDKWARIGACETGYGQRPGRWDWNSGTYQGAFGFYHGSWDAFRLAGYPSEAYLATPRQQYEVALAIWRRYGFSGWGCRGA